MAGLPAAARRLDRAPLEAGRIERYARLCGFSARQGVPPTFPLLLAFPLLMELLLADGFPYPVPGLVHLRNRIALHGRLSPGRALAIAVRFGEWRAHPRGQAFTVETVATDADAADADPAGAGAPVWESTDTYLRRGIAAPRGAPVDAVAPGPEPLAIAGPWRVTPELARAYARASGDRNPIHTSRLGARLFGFRRPIAHGLWSEARALAALLPEAPLSRAAIEVDFKAPVPLPASVLLLSTRDGRGGATGFELRDRRAMRPHLRGAVSWHAT